jgi:hypothetical protein
MNTKTVTIFSIIGAIVTIAFICIASYVSSYNYGNTSEQEIKAIWENNQNILAQYGQKIQEAAQIPTMQRDDVAKVLTGALGARYGAAGSQASMQWIKEQNPSLDPKVYIHLQELIEAGRDEFKTSQTRLIDAKRAYSTNLGYLWKGMWMHIAGYPKINLDDYKAITTDYAANAFKTGKETGPMQLR